MPRWEAQLGKDKNCWFSLQLSVDDALIDPWILDSPGQTWNGFRAQPIAGELEQHLQSHFTSLISRKLWWSQAHLSTLEHL